MMVFLDLAERGSLSLITLRHPHLRTREASSLGSWGLGGSLGEDWGTFPGLVSCTENCCGHFYAAIRELKINRPLFLKQGSTLEFYSDFSFPLPFLEEKDSWTPGPTDQRLLLGFCILRPSLLNFRVFPNSMNSCSSLERCPRWCALLFQGGTEKNFPLHNVPLSSFFCCVWTGVPQRHGCVNILRGVYLTCESLSHFGGACYNSIYKSSL